MQVVANGRLRKARAQLLLQLREHLLRTRLINRAIGIELLQRAAYLVERLDVQVHVRRAHKATGLDSRACRLGVADLVDIAPDLTYVDLIGVVGQRPSIDR